MINRDEIISIGKNTIQLEADCLAKMVSIINYSFANAVNEIHNCVGRIIVTGVGKSAIIAQKIVATFNSTGTPSVFMHAADAVHGDLGIIQKDDIIICISKSGNTPEIRLLIPFIKNNANKIICICGNAESYLAKQSDIFLNTFVEKEACPHNLAPTTSTTAQLAMGDALAVATLEVRNFTKQDFAKYHPGGTLGKQLILKVSDVILDSEKPEVAPNTNIKNVLFEISKRRLGATAVIENNNICGIITDGDIRRMLEKYNDISHIVASDIMNTTPKQIDANDLALDALSMMRTFNINQLMVTENGAYAGFIHIQELVKEGIV